MASIGTLAIKLMVQAQEMQSGFAQAQRSLQQFADRANSMVNQIKGVLATVGVSFGVFKAFEAFKAHETAVRSLNLTLTATGGAAGRSGAELQKMAKGLQDATSMSKTEILGGMQALAATGKVSGDTFDRATKLAVDLGARIAAAGGSAGEGFEILAHALTDPERGMRRLKAAHVGLQESQMATIKQMHEMGDEAGAQKVLLDAVQNSVNGFAEGSNTSMKKMQIAFQEVLEKVGGQVAPAFELLAGWVVTASKFFVDHGEAIGTVVKYLVYLVAVFASVKAALLIVQGAIALWTLRTKVATAAQAVWLALQGPKGWAQLAIGLGLGAAAVYGLGVAFDEVQKKADAAKEKTAAVSESTPKLTPFQIETKQHEEAAAKITEPLREQWRWLGLTGDALVLAKAKQQGLNWEQIKTIETLQRLIKEEAERAGIMKDGAATTEANKTALQKYADVIHDLDEQVAIDAITWDTYAKAVAKATEELEKQNDEKFRGAEGLAEGSKEAVNAVLKFQQGGSRADPQKRMEDLLHRAAEREARIAENTEETARQVAKSRDAIKKARLL